MDGKGATCNSMISTPQEIKSLCHIASNVMPTVGRVFWLLKVQQRHTVQARHDQQREWKACLLDLFLAE